MFNKQSRLLAITVINGKRKPEFAKGCLIAVFFFTKKSVNNFSKQQKTLKKKNYKPVGWQATQEQIEMMKLRRKDIIPMTANKFLLVVDKVPQISPKDEFVEFGKKSDTWHSTD